MNFAVACGYIEKNPTQGIRPNRRPRLTRFLSREEIGRLHRVGAAGARELTSDDGRSSPVTRPVLGRPAPRRPLDAQTGENNRQQADIIRLLLLTGCRKGEILRLRWSEVHRDTLFLADSKTGARKVPLNSQARSILERQPRDASSLVFPSPRNPDRPYSDNLALWYRVRRKAGIEDVRLHDLRHTHASHAVMNGVPVPVVSRMLGHSNVRMTLRYAHLGDREIEAAAERIGRSVAAIMDRAG